MKNQSKSLSSSTRTSSGTPVSVYEMVNRLLVSMLPEAVCKKSFIINDADRNATITADEDTLAYVVGSLMSSAVNSTYNGCIRVETVINEHGIQIRIRTNGQFFYSTVTNSFGQVVAAARKLGASIGLHSKTSEGVTAVFSITPKKAA